MWKIRNWPFGPIQIMVYLPMDLESVLLQGGSRLNVTLLCEFLEEKFHPVDHHLAIQMFQTFEKHYYY